MKGSYEYGEDTESYRFAPGSVPFITFMHTLCSKASKLLLECAPAFHSLLVKVSLIFKNEVHFLSPESSQER